MKNLKYLIGTACLSLVAPCIYGQYGDDYDKAIKTIVENNPAIMARMSAIESEKLTLSAENNFNDPDVEFEHQWGEANVGNKWAISVSQSFDWPGLYKRRSAMVKSGTQAYTLLYLAELSDLRLRAAQTLNDYVCARQRLEMAQNVKSNLDSIYVLITKAYEHGEATILDMKKIRFERAEAITRCENARQNLDALRFELIAMNGGKHIDLSLISSYPAYILRDEEYYVDRHSEADMSLSASQNQAKAARMAASAEKLKSYPGFSIGYIHNYEIGDHFNGLKLGMTLPLFSNRNKHAAAVATANSAQFEADENAINLHTKVLTEYSSAKKMRQSLDNYSEIFPTDGSDDYLRLLNKSYDGGQISLINYLYEINYYIEARLAYIELLNSYNQILASLNRYEI